MSLIKLSAGNDQYWLMNDIPHQRGQFDVSAKIGSDVVEIYSLNTLKSLSRANYDEYSPDGITPYASTQALINDLKAFFFHSVTGGGGDTSPLTTKGDLYTFDTDNQRLGVGADGSILLADSTQATGLKWDSTAKHVYNASLLSANWILDANDIYYQDVPHNLNTDNIGIEVYDSTSKETVIPEKLERTTTNNLRVFVKGNTLNLNVVIWDAIFGVQAESRPTVVNPVSPYTASNGDIIIWDATSGNKVLNLPAAATSVNYRIDIKKTDSSVNTLTVDPNGAELIEGGTTAVLTTQYESISIVCDGTEWWVLAAI